MQTGYDNFWMHSRLKPLPVLPKNDNYSCAHLTDSYKHMQNRGCPSHLSNFIPPQNNAGSFHGKDQYRNSNDQSMWPSSVYSLPFTPSYANNVHTQELFFGHTNNFVHSFPNPQDQEKHGFRHLEMSNNNVNIPTMHNTNTSTFANNGLAHAQNNKNTNTQIPRIRVKDVFSLNNQSIQDQLQLNDYFGTMQQKELPVHSADCNRASESQIQTEHVRYKSTNLVELSKSSHFKSTRSKKTCSKTQEQFQNSCSVYQQNDGSSLRTFEFNGGRQIGSNISSESVQPRTPASLLTQLLTQKSIPERGLQNCQQIACGHGNAQPVQGREKVMPMRNLAELQNPNYSDTNYSRSCGLNERAPENSTSLRNVPCDVQRSTTVINNVHCNLQGNLTKITEANLKSRNSASNAVAKNAPSIISKSPPLQEINNQQNCFMKIGIPNTGNSNFIGLNGSENSERNPALNLQNFFEQNDKNCVTNGNTHNIDEENEDISSIPLPAGESSFISHHASTEAGSIPDSSGNKGGIVTHKKSVPAVSTSLISPRNCQEDTIDHSVNMAPEIQQQNNKTKFQQKLAVEISGTEQEMPTNDFTATPLSLKEESFHPEIENTSLQHGQNPPGGREFHPRIKAEENYENLRAGECDLEVQPSETLPETVAQFRVEGCSFADKSRSESASVTDSGDHSDKVNTLKGSSSMGGDVQKSEKKKERREVGLSTVNYKSKINRDKLDLLIQFLKKDQGSDGTSSCKEQYPQETASNASSDSRRSRRKLNKASVVRNKNNSREMITLMSPRGSNLGSKNSEKTEVGKNSCSDDEVMVEEIIDISEEYTKCDNPWQEKESKKGDSWAEPNIETAGVSKQYFQESPEKPVPKTRSSAHDENAVIITVRGFQNSETHLCMSCKLVSSIESFWINVVSGEVRCLNCFKGNTLKTVTKENVLNSIKNKTEKENKSKDSTAVSGRNSWDENERNKSSKCEDALRKLNGMKENVRQELLQVFVWENHKSNERKQTTNSQCHTRKPSGEKVLRTEKSDISIEEVGRRCTENGTNQEVKDINTTRKRKSFSGEEDFARKEKQPSSIKQGQASTPKKQSEGSAREETAIKSEKSHGRRISGSEEGPENRPKTETKGVASSITRTNSDDYHRNVRLQCGEEYRYHRVSVSEEHGQKDLKVRHFTDESRKPLPREGWPAKEAPKRSAGYETWYKSKKQNIWREGHLHRDEKHPSEAKTSKLFPRRDPKAPDGLVRSTSNQNGVETEKRMESTEQPRKRKNSDEYVNTHKVHILGDFVKKDSAQASHSSKSSEAKASKDNDNPQRDNLWRLRISRENLERNDASKEEWVLFGEHSRKEEKPPPEEDKEKMKDPWKGVEKSSEPAKGKAEPRRKSRDEQWGPEKAIGRRSSEGLRRKSSDEESAVPSRAKLFSFLGAL